MMKHLIYIIILLMATSCSFSEDMNYSESDDVVLTFPIVQSEDRVMMARTMSSNDNSIRCIDLLIFDQAKNFSKRVQVNNISGVGATKSFSVRLPASNQASTIHVIANGRDENNIDRINFTSITNGLEEDKAINLLQTKDMTSATALTTPILMSGKVELPNISSATVVGKINLVRSVASIYIQCGTSMSNSADFVLTGFTLLKSAQKGRVIPKYNTSFTTPTSVSLPLNLKYIDYTDMNGVGIWANATSNVASTELYLYERTNVLDNTGLSVIVSGKYKGVDGYYKIWLQDNAGKAINIIRNHRYQVQISKVSGAGYPSLKEAIGANYSANIFTNIIDNNDDITDIVADSKHELGISSNTVAIVGSGRKVIGTVLNTNLDAGVKASTAASWITDIKLEGSGIRQTLTANFAGTSVTRKATITVRAGSLEKKIEVTQQVSVAR